MIWVFGLLGLPWLEVGGALQPSPKGFVLRRSLEVGGKKLPVKLRKRITEIVKRFGLGGRECLFRHEKGCDKQFLYPH
jgi:hypothetical protein